MCAALHTGGHLRGRDAFAIKYLRDCFRQVKFMVIAGAGAADLCEGKIVEVARGDKRVEGSLSLGVKFWETLVGGGGVDQGLGRRCIDCREIRRRRAGDGVSRLNNFFSYGVRVY